MIEGHAVLVRSAGALSVLCLVVLASAPLGACAQPARDGVYRAERLENREMRIDARIEHPRVTIAAIDNTNERHQVWVRYPRRDRPACGEAVLVLGGRTITNESQGSDEESCDSAFTLSAADATAAAALFRVPRQDRRPIGESVTGAFAPSAARVRPGEAIEVVLTLRNASDGARVSWQRGGSNRGPRDNQFALVILRDGRPVPPIEAMDFGGLSQRLVLEPGATAEVRAPIAAWGDISIPGRYEVRCAYETSLTPAGVDPYGDATRGASWDRRFEGVVRFEVR